MHVLVDLGKLDLRHAAASSPKAGRGAIALARLAAAISAFDGTQPVLRHSPPILPFSISTTGTPKRPPRRRPTGRLSRRR